MVDIAGVEVDPAVIRLIPADVASRFQVVPYKRSGRRLTVVMANPSNIFALDDIKFITGCEVETCVAPDDAIKKAIDRFYDSAESLASVMKEFDDDLELVEDAEEEGVNLSDITAEEAPVVKLVNSLLADAIRKGASDIHVEPFERSMRVRFRIDGELYEMMSPPTRLKSAMISRLKIMAELDIAERRIPQDGRIRLRMLNKNIDLRVSTLAHHLRGEGRDAYPGQVEPQHRPHQAGLRRRRRSRSWSRRWRCPTAWCWSPAPPGAGRPPPSTRPCPR